MSSLYSYLVSSCRSRGHSRRDRRISRVALSLAAALAASSLGGVVDASIAARAASAPEVTTQAFLFGEGEPSDGDGGDRQPYSRTTLFAFLIVMSLLPASATIGIWLLLNKLEARANVYIDEMTKLKADAVTQLQGLMEDAQSAIDGVRDRLETSVDAPSVPEIDGGDLEHLATISAGTNGRAAIPSAEASGVISPEDYCRRANALFLSGNYEDAVDSYDRAVALKPDYYQAWSNRGSALFNLGQYEASIASFDRALDLKTDYPEAWNNRGSSLIKLGDYDAAAFSFERATELKADHLEAWSNRGYVMMELGRYKEALLAYSQAVKLDPNSAQAWHERGRATLAVNRPEQALQCFDKAIGIAPDDLNIWRDRALAQEQLGRKNEAFETLSHGLRLDPDAIDLWIARAELSRNRRRYIEAIEDYDRALFVEGDRPDIWFSKACCYAASKESKSALFWLARAIEADPDYVSRAEDEPALEFVADDPTFASLVGREFDGESDEGVESPLSSGSLSSS